MVRFHVKLDETFHLGVEFAYLNFDRFFARFFLIGLASVPATVTRLCTEIFAVTKSSFGATCAS
jgi:hypothetical protein